MIDSVETEKLAGARLELCMRARPTPLLRVGTVLAKLESLRPAGSAVDRSLAIWDSAALTIDRARPLVAVVSGSGALAGAGWARARGLSLHLVVHGPLTHETNEALAIWGMRTSGVSSFVDAGAKASRLVSEGALLLPSLAGAAAAEAARKTLGEELLRDLESGAEEPSLLFAPAGGAAALVGSLHALRARWPSLRAIALHAAGPGDVLPDLPEADEAREFLEAALQEPLDSAPLELLSITRVEAQTARLLVARSHGLCASHGAAAALQIAAQQKARGAIAIVHATGEREFSLDPPATARSSARPRSS